jgi:hypothetical protein
MQLADLLLMDDAADRAACAGRRARLIGVVPLGAGHFAALVESSATQRS